MAAPTLRVPPDVAPIVILLDLDGTVVGRVNTLLCEYELHMRLAASAAKARGGGGGGGGSGSKRKAAAVSKVMRDSIVARLRHGIIRPHFEQLVRAAGPGVELFVYTASDDSWAAFLVPCIEAALGVRFNRPLFTRKHCLRVQSQDGSGAFEFRKSIRRLQPTLLRALRARYPRTLRTPGDLQQRTILVDNTQHVMADPLESARVVLCPTYDYDYCYDVLGRVDVATLHRHYAQLAPTLVGAGLYPPDAAWAHPPNLQHFCAVYYRYLSARLEASAASNARVVSRDRFWLNLLHSLGAAVAALASTPQSAPPLTDAAVRALSRGAASAAAASAAAASATAASAAPAAARA